MQQHAYAVRANFGSWQNPDDPIIASNARNLRLENVGRMLHELTALELSIALVRKQTGPQDLPFDLYAHFGCLLGAAYYVLLPGFCPLFAVGLAW